MASPVQVQAILAEVARIRPGLAGFCVCLYDGALRPGEAVALTAGCRDLPLDG